MAYRTCSIDVRRRRGFSVAEALTASVVLAVAVVGICGPLGAASEQAQVTRENSVALVLARELLEEIATKPLWDNGTTCHAGPETSAGETSREKYDSADDYANYHDTTPDMRTLGGQSVGFGADDVYTRDVAFEYRTTPSGSATTAGDFGLVTVTVTTPHKQVVQVSRLLSRYSLPG